MDKAKRRRIELGGGTWRELLGLTNAEYYCIAMGCPGGPHLEKCPLHDPKNCSACNELEAERDRERQR